MCNTEHPSQNLYFAVNAVDVSELKNCSGIFLFLCRCKNMLVQLFLWSFFPFSCNCAASFGIAIAMNSAKVCQCIFLTEGKRGRERYGMVDCEKLRERVQIEKKCSEKLIERKSGREWERERERKEVTTTKKDFKVGSLSFSLSLSLFQHLNGSKEQRVKLSFRWFACLHKRIHSHLLTPSPDTHTHAHTCTHTHTPHAHIQILHTQTHTHTNALPRTSRC